MGCRKALGLLVVCVGWCAAQVSTSTPEARVAAWSSLLSSNVRTLVKDVLAEDSVVGDATDTQWVDDKVDVGDVATNVHNTLYIWFELLSNIARDLQAEAEVFVKQGSYDTHYWDSEGYNETVMPGGLLCVIPTVGNTSDSRVRYSYDIDMKSTSVRISTSTSRENEGVIDFIQWSSRLDSSFAKKALKTPHVLNQFVTYQDAALRMYPARPWPKSHSGQAVPFDITTRPWYRNTITSSKDVVVILDASGSMKDKWDTIVELMDKLLKGLSEYDNFAVVLTGGTYMDIWGREWYKDGAEVLGCPKDTLRPATLSNRREINDIIAGMKPYGGTSQLEGFRKAKTLLEGRPSCAQAVILITDVAESDSDTYCDIVGYDENGLWIPGELCKFNETHDDLVDVLESFGYTGQVFSIGIRPPPTYWQYRGVLEVACSFDGTVSYAPESGRPTTTALKDFISWVNTASTNGKPTWSSPYYDASGSQEVLLTISRGFTYRDSMYGVVGADLPLSDIRMYLEESSWENAYMFLVNSKGEALVHPYLNQYYERTAKDAIYPGIEELEMEMNTAGVMQPAEFLTVKTQMVKGVDGTVTMVGPLRRLKGDGYTVVDVKKLYTWRRVVNTPFTFCIVQHYELGGTVRWDRKDQPIVTRDLVTTMPNVAGVYHRIDKYPAATLQSYDVRVVETNTTMANVVGFFIKNLCFCNVLDYTVAPPITTADVAYIDTQVNVNGVPPPCDFTEVKTYQIKPQCIHDVRSGLSLTSSRFRVSYSSAINWLPDSIVSRKYISTKGTVIMLPTTPIQKHLDPIAEYGYLTAVYDPSLVHISRPYTVGGQKRIAFSQAVMKGKDDVTSLMCSSDQDCGSALPAVCLKQNQGGVCSTQKVMGVLQTEVAFSKWTDEMFVMTRVAGETSNTTVCGGVYSCVHEGVGNQTCETRCYIMDSNGFVLWNSSATWAAEVTDINPPLAVNEGELMRQFVHVHKGYDQQVVVDKQGGCRLADTWPSRYTEQTRVAQDLDGMDKYMYLRGDRIPKNEHTEYCTQLQQTFSLNRVVFGSTLSGVLNDGCTYGTYAAQLVPSVDAVFVIITDYYSLLNSREQSRPPGRDFGCAFKNSIHKQQERTFNVSCPAFPSMPPSTVSNTTVSTCNPKTVHRCSMVDIDM
eukprot:TRINITY_DN2496_c0_g1_i1.p1 TRINITY_DN2496_c0_g1~~TRINITY_DN2496_c0_g1_i1.p1  ORF type:complete len:1160 (+),score=218.39 TRINITY_DN2496_c0_g1_i1:33-3482(+)